MKKTIILVTTLDKNGKLEIAKFYDRDEANDFQVFCKVNYELEKIIVSYIQD